MAQLVAALPVRNGAEDLPRWFESVRGVVDAVVALDDGSTDDTRALLDAEPLVRVVLENPRRASYAGWDDAANRQRLVDAIAPLAEGHDGTTWVVQIDADEVLAPGDGEALRRAVDHDVLDERKGYLLQVLRMVDTGDETSETFDEDHLWVGRLFAWKPGVALPTDALHLVPIPKDISPADYVRTTLRLAHYGSFDTAKRSARAAKYAEVDPGNRWQDDYSNLIADVGEANQLSHRPPSLPVIQNTPWPGEDHDAAAHTPGEPMMTAVIISRDDEAVIQRAVDGVLAQELSADLQLVVVTSGTDRTAQIVRDNYPEVDLRVIDHPALPGEARNVGLAAARGRYITFPGSHIELPPGALQARLDAHLDGWGMVTNTTLNGTRTTSGWASYFLDHSGGLPGRPSHEMTVAPSYASYLTAALRFVGGYPEHMRTAEDTVANTALFDLGYGAWRAQQSQMVHHSPCRRPSILFRHHYKRGQGFGEMLRRQRSPGARLVNRRRIRMLGPRYPVGRFRRVRRNVGMFGPELEQEWRRASPLAAFAIGAAWLGAWHRILAPRRGWLAEMSGDRFGSTRGARRNLPR